MAETLEKMAERQAAALGRAEAALTYIASLDRHPGLAPSVAAAALADIERIIAGKQPWPPAIKGEPK